MNDRIQKICALFARGGIVAVEDDVRQTYTVKHIRKGLTILNSYLLLLSFIFLVASYSRAGEAITLQEPQTNVIKSATVEYVPKAKIKVRTKVERAKNKIRAKVDRGKDKVERKTKSIKPKTKEKIRRKLFVPQASTN